MNIKYNTEKYGDETETGDAWASPVHHEFSPPVSSDAHHAAAPGFGQAFALHPILALTAIVTDCMVSTWQAWA
jgi:hypothetical protein